MSAALPPLGARRVLVTGGGTGIGRAVAEAVLEGGGRVAVCGRREAPLRELAAAHEGRVAVLPGDVADGSFRAGLLGRAREALGGSLDGFVFSAGVVVHQPPGLIDEESLRAQLELNLVAPLRLGEEALDVLEPGGGAVFVSSTLAHRPVPTSAAYSAAKAGMLAVMKTLAIAATTGPNTGLRVRFNAVSPGVVDTDMVKGRAEQLVGLHPLGRLGRPEEIAAAVLHLLGAPWATGTELVVDGGLLLRE